MKEVNESSVISNENENNIIDTIEETDEKSPEELKRIQFYKTDAESIARRKKMPLSEVYPCFDENHYDDDQELESVNLEMDAFIADSGFGAFRREKQLHFRQGEKLKVRENSIRKVFSTQRWASINSIFTLWACGTYDNLTQEDIFNLADDPEKIKAFADFCDKYPTLNETDPVKFKESAKQWGEVFVKGAKKIQTFTYPKIDDYTNPEEVAEKAKNLYKLARVCIDLSQDKESIFKNKCGLDGIKTVQEQLGGRVWDDTLDFFADMQTINGPLYDGYFNFTPAKTKSGNAEKFATTAPTREMANLFLKPLGGKKLGDIPKFFGAKKYYLQQMSSDLTEIKDANDEIKYEGLKFDDFINVTRGISNNNIKKILDKAITKQDEENKKQFIEDQINLGASLRNHIDFGDFTKEDNLYNKILAMDENDPEAYKTILNSENILYQGKERKGDFWLNDVMKNLLTENYRQYYTEFGLEVGDVLFVNGKSLKELYGEKYAGLTLDERNKAYQIEYLKKVAEGKDEIGYRTFAVNSAGQVLLGNIEVVTPGVKKIKALRDDIDAYNIGYKAIRNELGDYLKKLVALQNTDIRNADGMNISDEVFKNMRKNVGTIGSDHFKHFIQSLNDCVKALDGDLKTDNYETIVQSFKRLEQFAGIYHKERASIFGKRGNGELRWNMAGELMNLAPELLGTLQTLHANIDGNVLLHGGDKLNNAPLFKLNNLIESTGSPAYGKDLPSPNTTFAHIYKMDEGRLSENECNDLYEQAREIGKFKKEFTKAVQRELTSLKRNPNEVMVEKNIDEGLDAAYKIVLDPYIKKNDMATRSTDVGSNLAYVREKFKDGTIQKQAEKLAKNPIFKDFFKKYGNDSDKLLSKWDKFEKKVDKEIKNVSTQLQDMTKNNNMGLADYVDEPQTLDGKYRNLGEIVIKQMLVQPENRLIAQALETDKFKIRDAISEAAADLKRQNILGDGNLSPQQKNELQLKLNSLEYVNSVKNNIINSANREAARPAPRQAQRQNQAQRQVQPGR